MLRKIIAKLKLGSCMTKTPDDTKLSEESINFGKKTDKKWDVQIVEINQVGGILFATNAKNHYIKKAVKVNQKIV